MSSLIVTSFAVGLVFVFVSHRLGIPDAIANFFLQHPVAHWKGRFGYAALTLIAIVNFQGFSRISLDYLNVALFLFCGWLALSITWSHDNRTSIKRVLHGGITAAAALSLATNFNIEERITLLAVCSGMLLSVAVFESLRIGRLPEPGTGRFGVTAGPNKHATNCVVLILSCTFLMMIEWLPSVVGWFIICLTSGLLYLTRSRAQLWSCLLALCLWLALDLADGGLNQTGYLISVLATCIFSSVLASMLPTPTPRVPDKQKNTIASAINLGRNVAELKTFNRRLPLWHHVLHNKIPKRILLGSGYAALWTPDDWEAYPDQCPDHSHCLYLDVLGEAGLVALVLFVAIALFAVVTALALPTPHGHFVIAFLAFVLAYSTLDSVFLLRDVESFYLLLLLFNLGSAAALS
ncbi:O-antigen ligase family protein [Gammaproteobacteria bacterium]|nr:O-antigen ligase family protein [Gammaproteobacteria bacterium]